MGMTQPQVQRALQQLLPRGFAWAGPTLKKLLGGLSEELVRVNDDVDALVREAHPGNADVLLPDWENELGLPDACTGVIPSAQARVAAVVARYTALGGASPAYFIALAAALGYTITITEFRIYTCEMDCERPVVDETWAYYWQVNAPLATFTEFTALSSCDDPLLIFGNTILECVIRKYAPAHTKPIFSYS